MADSLIERASVVWWDSTQVYIRCPFCEGIHRHGASGSIVNKYHNNKMWARVAHCGSPRPEKYQLSFPFSGTEAWYEINKDRVLFVAAGVSSADLEDYFDPDPLAVSEEQDMSGRRKWTDATHTVTTMDGLEISSIEHLMISLFDPREVSTVKKFLETSPDRDLFLHGVHACEVPIYDDSEDYEDESSYNSNGTRRLPKVVGTRILTTGKTAIFMAAAEQSAAIVELLLEAGSDPNVADAYGRTPIMEAALWGRLENIKLLLRYGADADADCFSAGRRRRKAIDFARPLAVNTEERFRHAGREAQIYKEDTYSRDQDRKAIVRLLNKGSASVRLNPTPTSTPSNFVFTRLSGSEGPVSLLADFDVPGSKTTGVLFRDSGSATDEFPPVAAMSGWGHEPSEERNIQVDGKSYTNHVIKLGEQIEHTLRNHRFDQGIPGQYFACHTEKQLAAFFVARHCFNMDYNPPATARESRSLTEMFQRLEIEGVEQHQEMEASSLNRLEQLKAAEPSVRLRSATILIDRTMCSDCKEFIDRVNGFFGINLKVRSSVADQ